MTDVEIIKSIRQGNNEKPIKLLYKEFPKIKNLHLKSGINENLSQEIFNDSLVLLIEKLSNPNFELSSKLTTYLYGINRFLAKNELRKQNKKHFELDPIAIGWRDTLILSDDDLNYDLEKEQQLHLLEKVIDTLSEKCREIIRLFYYKKENMEQIVVKLDFSSVNSAKTQKYKCLEKASAEASKIFQS